MSKSLFTLQQEEWIREDFARCSDGVRSDIAQALLHYALYGHPVGDFLHAVLSDKLTESFARADHSNREAMAHIVRLVYNAAPSQCWGSAEKVKAWLAKGRALLEAEGEEVTRDAKPVER